MALWQRNSSISAAEYSAYPIQRVIVRRLTHLDPQPNYHQPPTLIAGGSTIGLSSMFVIT